MNAFLIDHHSLTTEYSDPTLLIETEDKLLRIANLELNRQESVVSKSGQAIDLTPRQHALLERFIRGQGQSQDCYPDISCDT